MSSESVIPFAKRGTAAGRLAVFAELIKARLTLMVLVTTAVGFYMGAAAVDFTLLFHALLGTGLVASGAQALNQYLEKDYDAKMQRTAGRPIPAGQIRPEIALLYGGAGGVMGLIWLAMAVNPITSVIGAVTLVSYVLIYTPLKRVTEHNTLVGAIPGALPPLMGWAAAQNNIALEGWALVAILFFWQLPHFFAISWMYRDEYAKAGFAMLSVEDETGERTSRQSVHYALALLPFSLLPAIFQMTGPWYFAGAIALGLLFLAGAINFARNLTVASARRLFYYSILYLPLLLGLMVVARA
ncbi:MAG: protoheme IX farnesyltransferase [Verrucomicrobiales bacterium]|nr:protoheme IX farnesyltransferase [Verrucomicrobiales bacterium]|tara:strand:+ start:4531 stop:5427 length:897 start_codon:yes stop_codon:yes gene_type:complete